MDTAMSLSCLKIKMRGLGCDFPSDSEAPKLRGKVREQVISQDRGTQYIEPKNIILPKRYP